METLREHGRPDGKHTRVSSARGRHVRSRGSPGSSTVPLQALLGISAASVLPQSCRWFQLQAVIQLARQDGRAAASNPSAEQPPIHRLPLA